MNGIKDRLAKIFGEESVIDTPEILDTYKSDCSFVPQIKPWYLVKPTGVSQIQECIQWANESGTPLVPVSSGAPQSLDC